METLKDIFHKKYRQYNVYLNDSPPIPMIIGRGFLFTTGITENPYHPDNACIELFERDGALFINSYYDEPGTTCNVIDHVLMFRVLKLLAKHMGFTKIELLDGSRKRTGTGCEWDLRILNRLYKEGPTFYEKHGFVPLADPLKRPIRFERIVGKLSQINQTYLAEHGIHTLQDLATHMHALCNRADFSTAMIYDVPLPVFFKQLSTEIKQTISASRGITEKESMTYSFQINPSIPSECHLRRAVFPIMDGVVNPTHGTGEIQFTLDPETLLDHFHTGGRRRRTRKVTRF